MEVSALTHNYFDGINSSHNSSDLLSYMYAVANAYDNEFVIQDMLLNCIIADIDSAVNQCISGIKYIHMYIYIYVFVCPLK